MAQTGYTPIILYHSTTAAAAPTSGNLNNGELALNIQDEKLYFKNAGGTVKLLASSSGAAGDVVGPASSTDNAIVRFDGTTGKLVQNSVVTIADSTGDISGVGQLNATTLDATNLEVTNIKAKDGTASATIANSTGVITIGSSVLTTTDINGGTIDGTAIGSTTPNTGAFTTLSSTGNTTLGDASTDTVTVNGYMGVGVAASTTAALYLAGTPPLTPITQYGILLNSQITSTATTAIVGVRSRLVTPDTAFTTTSSYSFWAGSTNKGASHTITNMYGFYTDDQTVGTNNYGFYSAVTSGANKYSIYTGTAVSYFGGNVGIGTSSPNYLLHLHRAAAASSVLQLTNTASGTSNTDGFVISLGNSLGVDLWNYENEYVRIGTNNTERLRIDSSGNVGIGTSSPGYNLEVNGTANFSTLYEGGRKVVPGSIFAFSYIGSF